MSAAEGDDVGEAPRGRPVGTIRYVGLSERARLDTIHVRPTLHAALDAIERELGATATDGVRDARSSRREVVPTTPSLTRNCVRMERIARRWREVMGAGSTGEPRDPFPALLGLLRAGYLLHDFDANMTRLYAPTLASSQVLTLDSELTERWPRY